MKKIIVLSLLIFASCGSKNEIEQVAQISCGQCNFELDSEDGCTLAVKIDNKAYFVEGFEIDDFGDAHDEKIGFCNVIREGKISGNIKNGKFVAKTIKLIE